MFTGIVEEVGIVESLEAGRLRIGASTVLDGVGLGDSIAVNGCCLTVVEYTDKMWEADLSEETLIRTAFRQLGVGTPSIWSAPSQHLNEWEAILSKVTSMQLAQSLNRSRTSG